MIPVLTNKETYKLDKETIDSGCLTNEQLMDNAGKAVAQFFCEKTIDTFNQNVLVVCGKGNNGGDGVIAHSYLRKYNISSKIIFTEYKHGHSELIKKYKISRNEYCNFNDKIKFNKYNWIIDAIFGIGLSRDLDNKYKQIIKNLNQYDNIISIDIPSGMFVDTDKSKYYINSKHVITFGYTKLGHYLHPLNSIFNYNIGLKKNKKTSINLIVEKDIYKIIKNISIKNNIHKYSKGLVGICAGSNSYPGAAILSSQAAYKTGSGYVILNIDTNKDLENNIKSQYPNIVVNKFKQMVRFVLFGPGLTFNKKNNEKSFDFKTLKDYDNIVCDASILSEPIDITINDFPQNSILTPHIGECKNLFNISNTLKLSSFKYIQHAIDNRIVILKSFNTFIITKDFIYIMDKGPSILSTAGTGDVLSGILVSLLSQGYSRLDASILGTYLHAEAANYFMENISKDGMTALDLIECIPHAFNKLRGHDVI